MARAGGRRGRARGTPAAPWPKKIRKRWERGWALVGVWSSLIFWVAPYFFTQRVYQSWQRGERPRPTELIVFGMAFVAVVVGLFVGFRIYSFATCGHFDCP